MGVRLRTAICCLILAMGITGLVPSASAAPLPIEIPGCGDPVDHSFQLGGPMSCPVDGIVVDRSGITIDLGGFTVLGDGSSGTDRGIAVGAFNNVTIRNGVVRRFGEGVAAGEIGPSVGHGVTIVNIIAVDNLGDGVSTIQDGSLVKGSVAVANEGSGMDIRGDGSRAIGNRVVNNDEGIIANSDDGEFRGNESSGNDGRGFWVGGNRNLITKNKVTGNGNGPSLEAGIDMQGSSRRNVVSKNVIVGNGGHGYLDLGTRNAVIGNVAQANSYYQGSSNNGGAGIFVDDLADKATGSGNRSTGGDALATQCVPAKFCVGSPGNKKLPKFQPSCNVPVVKSFRLKEDMVCPGNGIIVGADGITIDLNGRTVRGDKDLADIGIVLGTTDDVTITNGVVRAFGNGITAEAGSHDDVISRVVTVDNDVRGLNLDGEDHLVTKSVFVANDSDGLSIIGTSSNVTDNRIANNEDGGIRTDGIGERGNVFARNNVSRNATFGFRTGAENNDLISNVFTANGDEGANLTAAALGSDTTTNLFIGNYETGLLTDAGGSHNNGNIAYGNGYDNSVSDGLGTGIDASGAAFADGSGNVSAGNDAVDQCAPDPLCA